MKSVNQMRISVSVGKELAWKYYQRERQDLLNKNSFTGGNTERDMGSLWSSVTTDETNSARLVAKSWRTQ